MERRKPIVGDSTTLEDSLVSKNARFAHDMVNFESDVRRKRFSAHAAMKRMKSVPDEQKKHPGNSEVLS